MRIIKDLGDGCHCFWLSRKVDLLPKYFAMNKMMIPELREVMEAQHYRPAVSLIMPFEPKISLQTELRHALKTAADRIERQLDENFPEDMSKLVFHKLTAIIDNLDFNTHKKSIAIYVSPVFEKVLYLDIAVEEKIIIDESFEIRDLLYSKKQMHKYLVLLLSGKESRLYLATSATFIRITSDTDETVAAYQNDIPEKVANFSNSSDQKQILVNKFLHSIDDSLDKILQVYQFPLFVLGAEKILGQFKKITKHQDAVVDYVHGNYEDLSLVQLGEILKPAVTAWIKRTQQNLLLQLEDAAGKNKLAIGMRDVWKHAMHQRGRLLLVEQNYMYAAVRGSHEENIYKLQDPYNKFSLIKDAVDDVIEAVLQNGGDVEFVDSDLLKPYHHIALILYY